MKTDSSLSWLSTSPSNKDTEDFYPLMKTDAWKRKIGTKTFLPKMGTEACILRKGTEASLQRLGMEAWKMRTGSYQAQVTEVSFPRIGTLHSVLPSSNFHHESELPPELPELPPWVWESSNSEMRRDTFYILHQITVLNKTELFKLFKTSQLNNNYTGSRQEMLKTSFNLCISPWYN